MTQLMKSQRVIIKRDGISTIHSVKRTVRVFVKCDYQGGKAGQVKINNRLYTVEQRKGESAWYGETE